MTIYGYCRVSTSEQGADDKTSIETQSKRIMGAALMRGEMEEPIVFKDIGVSGAVPFEKRPSGSALYAKLRNGDVVIASKLDRLFRSASDALVTAEKWKAAGIGLVLCDIGVDSVMENGVAKLFFSMMASFAEFDKTRLLERTAEGKAGKKARGGFTGGTPVYGTRVEGVGRDAKLVPDFGEQQVLARVKELRGKGLSLRNICRRLEIEGKLSRNGTAFFAPQIVRMLDSTSKAV